MKAFTGLLAILFLGAIQGEDLSSRKERSNVPCINYPGNLYHYVRQSLAANENFAVSPLGVLATLNTVVFATDLMSMVQIPKFIAPKCEKSSAVISGQKFLLTHVAAALTREGVAVSPKLASNGTLEVHIFRTNFAASKLKNAFNEFIISKINDKSIVAIDDHLSQMPSEATKLLLFNRFRFVAQFEQKFSLENKNLVARQIEALHGHIPALKAQAMGLPLLGTSSFLLILLPDKGVDLITVELGLQTEDVRQIPSKLKRTLMDITMERIVENKYIYMRDALERAGVRALFEVDTDEHNALARNTPVNNFLTISGIQLSEDGINTEGAPFKLQKYVTKKPASGKPLEFKAQGPIVYAIVDQKNVYLIGRRT